MEPEPFYFSHTGAMAGTRSLDHLDEDTMPAVNHFALRPLTPEEVAVFTLDLCHDQVDRHFSRFPEEELERISRMTPGRPLMERHDLRGSLPRGTFFRSHLHRQDGRVSVRPEVYVLRTPQNHDFILNIEGGVYRETSIGFSFRLPECSVCGKDLRTCAHIPGRAYGGHPCHFIMRDVLEVIEGSVVPAGSQGTRFVSRQQPCDGSPLEPANAALTRARERFHLPIELQRRGWAPE